MNAERPRKPERANWIRDQLELAQNSMSHSHGVPFMDLWVRAGSDGLKNGADPVCQQIFMILLLKAGESDSGLQFNVKTTNPNKPQDEFREAGLRHVPALVHKGETVELLDDIIEYIDEKFPLPSLQYFDPDAEDATNDLFSKFCFFIKEVNKDPKAMETELRKIDEFLKDSDSHYLTGNKMSHLDCRILPVLQHIRVAANALKSYNIPNELKSLWEYMKRGYQSDIFTKTYPADQEIILYWADRPETPNLTPTKRAEMTRQQPKYSIELPDDIK